MDARGAMASGADFVGPASSLSPDISYKWIEPVRVDGLDLIGDPLRALARRV
jgi:hypothetical protein